MIKTLIKSVLVSALVFIPALTITAQVQVDPAYEDYTQVPGVSGNIKSVGSDSMNNEMTLWA